MPRQCAVCISSVRVPFEAAVQAGQTVKDAARGADLPYPAAKRHIRGHVRATLASVAAPGTAASAVDTFERATGHAPMDWQRSFLAERRDTLLLKGRQIGATEAASALAIHVAMTKPGSTSAIISPSLRQSTEVTLRARLGFWALGETLRQDSTTLLRTASGSRIVSLPGSARGIRGYSCELVVVDEAAFVDDATFVAARPLTAATGGRLIVQSTPGAPVGTFYELASAPPPDWAFMTVRSDEVPTIDPAFLERERRDMAPDLYRQEYECVFAGAGGGLFSVTQVESMFLEETA